VEPDDPADAVASALPAPSELTTTPDARGAARSRRAEIGRAAATITLWNSVSRVTGFVRVIAIAGALGIATLGDAYQRANEVSNVLFELLAGGLLFAVLVPSFVQLLGDHDTRRARDLGSALVGRGLAALSVVVVVGMAGSHWIMRVLTAGVNDPSRPQQIDLGAFLLVFILPQLLLYAWGSVASAVLQADHRFVATSIAPVFNNILVIATMVAFAIVHDPSRGLSLTGGEKVLLGGGTLAGTLVMTAVPLFALRRCGLGIGVRWHAPDVDLRPLARQGLWGAGHIGLNEVLIGVTIILAGRVDGGVIAYQTAFTFFLLPHALLAHPIFTALFPRLSRQSAPDQRAQFAGDLSLGLRTMLVLLLPAAGLMGAAAPAALSLVRLGQLDASGARLVALVLAGYLVGLAGYSSYYLLTRASYALGDVRRPTVVNAGVTSASIVGMVVATSLGHGVALLVSFGVINAVAVTAGSVALFLLIRHDLAVPVPVAASVGRALTGALIATAAAVVVAVSIGWRGRLHAVAAGAAVAALGPVLYVGFLVVSGAPEIEVFRRRLPARLGGGRAA
jgi:putative peptidoglycan lipid II flippase